LHGIRGSEFLELTPFELYTLDKDYYEELKAEKDLEYDLWKQGQELAAGRTAQILAAIYNNNPNRKKGAKILKASDFLPETEEQKKRKAPKGSPEEKANNLLAKATVMAAKLGKLNPKKKE
jgi:hypothetical protein